MLVNKSYNQEQKLKEKELDVLFNKVLIKLSLNITNKTSYPLALNLLREEIQKIICISILMEFNIIFRSLLQSSLKYTENKLLIDNVIKILLLSSKQKITRRLCITKEKKFIRLNPFNSWILKDIESDNYYLFMIILNWLTTLSLKKNSSNLIQSLIENFVIKLSNIMVYEIFYKMSLSNAFYMEYSTDFPVFKKNLQILLIYFYLKRILQRGYSFSKKIYYNNYHIMIFTKKGFVIKNLSYSNLNISTQINQTYTSFPDIFSIINS